MYVWEQNVLISIIAIYMMFTLLEELGFALMIELSPKLILRSEALITPFAAIMCKFVFIADGLINKNIHQITAYMFLILFSVTMTCFGFKKTSGSGIVFNILTLILVCIDGIYSIFLVRSLRQKYTWYFYKKLGLCEEIQTLNRLKQRLNVIFKLSIFFTLTNFEYPVRSESSITTINYMCLGMAFVIAFLYTQWIEEENLFARLLTIVIVLAKLALEIVQLIVLANQIIYLNIFVLVSLAFSIVNKILFIYFLICDMKTFGNNCTKELKRNVRQKREVLEKM